MLKSFFSITGLAIALAPITWGLAIALHPSPVLAEVISRRQIQQQVIKTVAVAGLPTTPTVTKLTLQGEFGLASWVNGDASGTVALQAESGRWQVIKLGGGIASAAELSKATSIPQHVAQQLLMRQGLATTTKALIGSLCAPKGNTFLAVETKSYRLSICGGDQPATYVGTEKRRPDKAIRLPLKTYDLYGPYFEVVNGDITYILANSTKGKNLTVSKGTRELLREPVVNGW